MEGGDLKKDGVKGIVMILIAMALSGYAIYLGNYEILLVVIMFYFALVLMDKFMK